MGKHLKQREIRHLKKLRAEGWSLNELKNRFNIAQGTAWRHVNKVKIMPEYFDLWVKKKKGSLKRKIEAENSAISKAGKRLKSLSLKEKELILISLYWAEGAKKDFNVTNTDPDMILLIIRCLKEVFDISEDRVKINIRIYEDMDEEKCVGYWLLKTGLASANLSSVNVLKGRKLGKLPYGMCRLRLIKGGDMLKYMVAARRRIVELSCSRSSTDRTEVS
jgi:hypothetical protein